MSEEQEALQAAVEAMVTSLREQGGSHDEGVVVDWIVVAQTTSFGPDGQQAGYYNMFSTGQMPEHRAIGLLEYGSHLIKFGGSPVEDDD